MPDEDQPKKVGETERSFSPREEDGYQTDTFSRNDREGRPAVDAGGPDELAEDERVLEAGEEGGYQADLFSRNDEEGVPKEDLARPAQSPGASAATSTTEGTQRKAADDADSRDAPPMSDPREGGVR